MSSQFPTLLDTPPPSVHTRSTMSTTSTNLTPHPGETPTPDRRFDLPAKELVLCYEKDLQEVAATCECADDRRLLKKAAGAMGRARRGHKVRRPYGAGTKGAGK